MKLALPVCLLLLILIACPGVRAQIKTIEIDTLTGLPNAKLPFDEPFVLKIPVTAKRVKSVSYIELDHNQDFQKSLNLNKPIISLSEQEIGVPKKIGSRYYLFAQFKNPHLLDPGRQYTVFWTEDVSDEVMKLFDTYDDFVQGNAAAEQNAKKQYDDLVESYKKRIGVEFGFTAGRFDDVVPKNYNSNTLNIKPKYAAYRQALDSYDSTIATAALDVSLYENGFIEALQTALANPSPSLEKQVRKKYLTDPKQSIAQLEKLLKLDRPTYTKLLLGIEDINCNACDPTDGALIEKRATNLATTSAAVNNLYELATLFRVAGQPAMANAENALLPFRDQLRGLKKKFDDEVLKDRLAIRDAIYTIGLSEPQRLNGDTYIPLFETRTKLSITPDFGLVTTRIGNDGANPYSFVPYLGFHINLRPINRDVPFRSYPHKPLHYISLMGGVSLVNLDNGPKMSARTDSVRSFFGGGKGTLLTGVGYRLGNVVRLTGGFVWYFNFLPGTYQERKLKVWPFVGLSLDLSIKDLLNGISDAFKEFPRRAPAAQIPVSATPVN